MQLLKQLSYCFVATHSTDGRHGSLNVFRPIERQPTTTTVSSSTLFESLLLNDLLATVMEHRPTIALYGPVLEWGDVDENDEDEDLLEWDQDLRPTNSDGDGSGSVNVDKPVSTMPQKSLLVSSLSHIMHLVS